MKRHLLPVTALAVLGTASACTQVGGPGASTYFECDRGTRLKVDFMRSGALVSVNNGRPEFLRNVPSGSGAMYENKSGWRLHTKDGGAVWNTALRSAPETCRPVIVPR